MAQFIDNWVAEATTGHVKMTAYHNNSLDAPTDLLSMVKNRGVDMLINRTGQMKDEFPVTDVVQLPFVASNPTIAIDIIKTVEALGTPDGK